MAWGCLKIDANKLRLPIEAVTIGPGIGALIHLNFRINGGKHRLVPIVAQQVVRVDTHRNGQ